MFLFAVFFLRPTGTIGTKKGSAMGQSVLYLADEQKDMIDHYDHPICECGVRLADMVCLKREL